MGEIAIGIVGGAGRMGRMLAVEVAASEGCRLAGGTEAPGHPALGTDIGSLAGIGEIGVHLGADAGALFAASDAVLDFTTPAASVVNAGLAAEAGTALVIGTTGLDEAQAAAVRRAAERAPIVWAPNMSLATNLLFALTERVAAALDADYDIEIVEAHHRHKVDAPSGTALALGAAAARGRGVDLETRSVRGRDGASGPRRRGDIGFAALRGGNITGEHTVLFAGEGERLELTHRASSRRIYARGAIRAARWLADRPPGLYAMNDVLGLK